MHLKNKNTYKYFCKNLKPNGRIQDAPDQLQRPSNHRHRARRPAPRNRPQPRPLPAHPAPARQHGPGALAVVRCACQRLFRSTRRVRIEPGAKRSAGRVEASQLPRRPVPRAGQEPVSPVQGLPLPMHATGGPKAMGVLSDAIG